jgi:dihydroorotase-like cyclic amidohydrolase
MMAKLYGYLLSALALLGGVVGFFFYAKRQGKKDEQAAEVKKSLEQAKEANAIDSEVHNLSQSELDERLRLARRPPPE